MSDFSRFPSKTGILLVNLGTPDAPERGAVYRYLKQFLLDPRVIDIHPIARNLLVRGIIAPFRSGKSAEAYRELWTEKGSPLKYYGESLANQVQQLLGDRYVVALGMRYQSPSLEAAVERLMRENVSAIKVFTLFPQYAGATVGTVHEALMDIFSKKWEIPRLEFINSYPTWEPMINLFATNARRYDLEAYDHILFSYHGLPQRQLLKADRNSHCLQDAACCRNLSEKNQFCYSAQCYATSAALAHKLGIAADRYTVCFQSRLGRAPWTQPYTIQVIERLAKESGAKRLLVFCPAFTADCLETIVEIGREYKEAFIGWGGERLDLVESLNDAPQWARAIAERLR